MLEYFPADEGMADIAGLEGLKAWLSERRAILTDPSRAGKVVKSYRRVFPVSAIYKKSQKICEMIRGVTLAQGIDFIDTRPTFRAAAAQRPMHGPKDWMHLNENGYRVLGSYLAKRLGAPAADACDDRWDAADTVMSVQSPASGIPGAH